MSEEYQDCGTWMAEEIPASWKWERFEVLFKDVTSSEKKIKQGHYLREGQFPIVDQGQALVGGYTNDEAMLYGDPLPVVVFGDHTRCVKFLDTPFAQGADGVKILQPSEAIDPRYGYWALTTIRLPNKGYSRHFKFLRASSFPIAPLPEQCRIAAKLEELLNRVDACRKRLEQVPRLLKQFRQSVLAAVCSGRLTVDWRSSDGYISHNTEDFEYLTEDYLLPPDWRIKRLGDVADKIQDGNYGGDYPKESEWTTSGVPFITGTALGQRGNIIKSNLRYVSEEKNKVLKKAQIEPGDIIFPNRGARDAQKLGLEPMGYLIPESFGHGNINPQLTLIRVREGLDNNYLKLCLDSEFFLSQHRLATTGSALAFINLTKTKAVAIPIPPIEEQREIVRRVQDLFKITDAVEDLYIKAQWQLDKLPQSILAKAFRGELVPQDPDDEPASRLLDRIRQDRCAAS